MINEGLRASEVINRIRDLLHKAQLEKAPLHKAKYSIRFIQSVENLSRRLELGVHLWHVFD